MNRTCVAVAISALLALPCFAHAAGDTAPSTPGNVSVKLYAGAGGELFWQRSSDDRGVRGYEITRNGTHLGVRDALSFYDSSLQANTAYTFTITAIDTAGQRSPTATVRVGGAAAPVRTPVASLATSGSVASPAGLRATVYSRSNAELFWNRSTDASLRYEVRRNGVVVDASSSGTSFYASGLVAGLDYHFELFAISGNARSAAARIVVRTDSNGSSTGTAASTPVAAPVAPPVSQIASSNNAALAPSGLRLAVYSGTTAELLWTPANPTNGAILRNEVRRNGVLIATLAGYGQRSYMDRDRQAGTQYSYEVKAISAAASGSASLSGAVAAAPVAAPRPVAAGPLAGDTAARLAVDFELLNGGALEKAAAVAERLRNPERIGLRRTSATANEFDSTRSLEVWACTKGGSVEVVRQRATNPDGSISSSLVDGVTARDCAIGPLVVSADNFIFDTDPSGERYLYGSDLSIDDARDLSTIEMGTWSVTYSPSRPDVARFFARDLTVEKVSGSYSARHVSAAAADPNNALPGGTFGLTAEATGVTGGLGSNSSIRTEGPFEFGNGRTAGKPTVGRLSIASGQNSWKIDAFNGDANTFAFTANVDGSAVGNTVPWSDTYRLRGIDPARVQVGF